MARLVTSGFELQDRNSVAGLPDGKWFGTNNTETTIVRSGSASAKFSTNAGGRTRWEIVTTLGTDVFLRAYIYVPTGGLPVGTASVVLGIGQTGFGQYSYLGLQTDGSVRLMAWTGAAYVQQGSASSVLALNTWSRLELRCRIATGSIDQCEGMLNGASFASGSGLAIVDAAIDMIEVGDVSGGCGAGLVTYFDDVAVNDSSGGSQNTWPGEGKVALLVPISDNAVGTGWTLGTGTAISGNSGSTAVKNKVPLGVADLAAGSDVKQIRNASANANVNYDANLTTYATAGIGAYDVNVLVPIVATAAPVVTSAKAGTVGIVSNPAIANIALGAGGTAGAFWSGVAGGAYPTGWKWSFGTTTYGPALVTVGASPVMRITQVTSSTLIAVVCFMGMYVEYSTRAGGSIRSVLQAVNRAGSY